MNSWFSKHLPAKRVSLTFSWRFFAVFFAVLFFDQLTKLLAFFYISGADETIVYNFNGEKTPISIIDNFFYLVYITNKGAAWGILSGQTFLLTSVALLTLLGLWLFRHHLGFQYKSMHFAAGLFCGGVIGNMIDRLWHGSVIDFLDVHLPIVNYRWPAFNIADCAIAVGVGIYIIFSLILDYREKHEIKSGANKAKGGAE